MASPRLQGRRVDLGAAYFTVSDSGFAAVAAEWTTRGLAREWTPAFDAIAAGDGAGPARARKAGPMRWAAPDGLRSLVRDLLDSAGVAPELGTEVLELGTLDHDAVVLAMPDPQAARLLGDTVERSDTASRIEWIEYEPVIAVAAGWPERTWRIGEAAFVNGDAAITLIADDGSRRGDGAPVLVAHSTPELARAHLREPDAAVEPVLAAVRRLLDIAEPPAWTRAHRWTYAKPVGTHGDLPFDLVEYGGRPVAVCGDSWCSEGSPRVESAWLSGTRVATSLAARLTTAER
jgi:renalase